MFDAWMKLTFKEAILVLVLGCGIPYATFGTASLLMGCGAVSTTTPPAALGPGYNSPADQTLGQSLAAINGFVTQETKNYALLSPALQTAEKPYLNAFITAVDLANSAYTAYHAGTQTLAQAQAAYNAAQTAQTNFTTNIGVK
jgi:hypothetical protein